MPGLFAGTPLERPVTCEVCEKVLAECRCPRGADGKVKPAKDQQARVQRERRAGGKMMTVVRGLDPKATDLQALLKALKSACAAGGAVTADGVEVQGDHRERIVSILKGMGYPAKAAGG
jgi:translation initiation factor 1